MHITPEIAEAIGKAVEDVGGTNVDLAKLIHVHGSTIGQWRNGRIRHLDDASWESLLPFVSKHLPGMPGLQQHPCNTMPAWFQACCRAWPRVPEANRQAVQAVVELAVAATDRKAR